MFRVSAACVRLSAVLGLAVLLAASSGADDEKPKKKPNPVAKGTAAVNATILAQLAAQFNTWDANSDLFLDKSELAKAFRGPDAKPYDYKPKSKTKDVDKEDTEDKQSTSKSSSSTAYDDYPDYQFLKQWDKNGDEKLSKEEYTTWAKEYAASLKPVVEAEQRILQAEKRLAQHKPGTRQHRQAEQELRHERDSYQKLSQKLKTLDRHVYQALRKTKQ